MYLKDPAHEYRHCRLWTSQRSWTFRTSQRRRDVPAALRTSCKLLLCSHCGLTPPSSQFHPPNEDIRSHSHGWSMSSHIQQKCRREKYVVSTHFLTTELEQKVKRASDCPEGGRAGFKGFQLDQLALFKVILRIHTMWGGGGVSAPFL